MAPKTVTIDIRARSKIPILYHREVADAQRTSSSLRRRLGSAQIVSDVRATEEKSGNQGGRWLAAFQERNWTWRLVSAGKDASTARLLLREKEKSFAQPLC